MRQVAMGVIGVVLLGGAVAAKADAPVCCASDDHGIRSHAVATDLGKVSPGTENYSRVPGWQAFVFSRNGVRYVELADASGLPRAAFTVVDGSVLALPVGGDIVQQVAFAPTFASLVFDDASVAVGVVTNADGSVSWQVFVK